MTDINIKDTDSLYNRAFAMGEYQEGELDDLSMGSLLEDQDWETNWDEPEAPRPSLRGPLTLSPALPRCDSPSPCSATAAPCDSPRTDQRGHSSERRA